MTTTLYQMLEANFGLKTSYHINPLVAQVQIALTKLLSYNPNRIGLIMVNNGAVSITVSPVNTVTVGNGIILVPNGGSISFKWDIDFELLAGEFFGRADGAASNIYILEVVSI